VREHTYSGASNGPHLRWRLGLGLAASIWVAAIRANASAKDERFGTRDQVRSGRVMGRCEEPSTENSSLPRRMICVDVPHPSNRKTLAALSSIPTSRRTAIRLADFEIGERGWLVHVLYRDEGIRSAFDALWNLCRHAIERCAATKATSLKVNADGVYARSSPSELAASPLIRSCRMP
jgi:hypothetical protein